MWIELPSVSTFQESTCSVFAGDFGMAAETPAETRNLSFQSQRHASLLSWACGGSGHGMHHLQQVLSVPWLINTETALQGEAGFTAEAIDTAEPSQSRPPLPAILHPDALSFPVVHRPRHAPVQTFSVMELHVATPSRNLLSVCLEWPWNVPVVSPEDIWRRGCGKDNAISVVARVFQTMANSVRECR